MKQKQQLIKEFLFTINPNKTRDQLEKQINNIDIQLYEDKKLNIYKISVKFLDQLTNSIYKINFFLDSFGWFPSYIAGKGKYTKEKAYDLGLEKNITIIYEAKFDVEIELKSNHLYHITFDLKWPKIKVNGLTPKSQGKLSNHPERVYFLENKPTPDQFIEIGFSLLNNYEHQEKVKTIILLEIDISKLKNFKVFRDPAFIFSSAIYSYELIPPVYIKVIDSFDSTY